MKRAVEAIEALETEEAAPISARDLEERARHQSCYRPGEPCSKHKRGLSAIMEGLAAAGISPGGFVGVTTDPACADVPTSQDGPGPL